MARLHKFRGLFFLEISKNVNCVHQHLTLEKETGETICLHCRRTIYMKRKSDGSDYLAGSSVPEA
ncbi:MAG: hypothetical protein K0S26_1373 [Bacteroidota bacterium]|nr:hypothetical protein [Bacteroidota bacterium]